MLSVIHDPRYSAPIGLAQADDDRAFAISECEGVTADLCRDQAKLRDADEDAVLCCLLRAYEKQDVPLAQNALTAHPASRMQLLTATRKIFPEMSPFLDRVEGKQVEEKKKWPTGLKVGIGVALGVLTVGGIALAVRRT